MSTTSHPDPLSRRWPWLLRLFLLYVRRFVARHFHAVRVSGREHLDHLPDGPLIVAITHPSWWDPMIGAVLTTLLPDRLHVAPIEGRALQRYRFFERLGFFGIDPGTSRGYQQLLAVADQTLSRDDVAFWITPQGRFADVRQRPLALRPGVGHLAHRLRGGTVLPIALEYSFWTERLPEALVRIGLPIRVPDGRALSPEQWTRVIGSSLTEAQDALGDEAMSRDPARFSTVLSGAAGTTWAYDAWSRLRAWLRGERYAPEHAAVLVARRTKEVAR